MANGKWGSDFPGHLTAYDLAPLGADPLTVLGSFASDQVPLHVVAKHPHLHISSTVNRVIYNRYIPQADLYQICTGDRDPSPDFS